MVYHGLRLANVVTTNSTLITKSELIKLPIRLQHSYILRRLLRLAQFMPKKKHQLIYNEYVKLKFKDKNHTYDKRLKLVLNEERKSDTIDRAVKTLELINKAATFAPEYEIESKILMNLLMFEESKLKLVERLRKSDRVIDYYVQRLEYFTDDNKEFNSIREMERCIMRFNEVEGTCL